MAFRRLCQEPTTTPYSLSRIQIPTGTLVSKCNHRYGLIDMWTSCRHVHVRPHFFTLTAGAHVTQARCSCLVCRLDWNWPISREKHLKIVCKNALALTYYESCRLLVMGSWPCVDVFSSFPVVRNPNPLSLIG